MSNLDLYNISPESKRKDHDRIVQRFERSFFLYAVDRSPNVSARLAYLEQMGFDRPNFTAPELLYVMDCLKDTGGM